MPRYHFHVVSGLGIAEDFDGAIYPDDVSAIEHAKREARDLAAFALRADLQKGTPLAIRVKEEGGRPVETVRILDVAIDRLAAYQRA